MTEFGYKDQPLVSIVIPTLNEEITIGEFIDWCFEGLRKAGVKGQVLIIDSSTDKTGEIAKQKGAEVIHVPKRGLGRAYIDALPYIRGKYVIMGDADLTYDFREIKPFVEKLEEGYDFVIGSRFKGYIEPNSMPVLHQYFGTPLTTWILNYIYGTRFSDIHCGMRAITLDALKRLNLESQNWEYASEMILKAVKLKLRCTEVPIRFYKDREGRLSHHKRTGWTSSWVAGWINLRVMFLYGADFFLKVPGWLLFGLGTFLTILLAGGEVSIGFLTLNIYWMLLGITLSLIGYSFIMLWIISKLVINLEKEFSLRISRIITYNRGVGVGFFLLMVGIVINLNLLLIWIRSGLRLAEFSNLSIFGLFLIMLGFQTFIFTLIIQMLLIRNQREVS